MSAICYHPSNCIVSRRYGFDSHQRSIEAVAQRIVQRKKITKFPIRNKTKKLLDKLFLLWYNKGKLIKNYFG